MYRFVWTLSCETAFSHIEKEFNKVFAVTQFNWGKDIVLDVDAFDYISARIMSQKADDGLLRSVAFFSKKQSHTTCNQEIHSKKIPIIICRIEEWRLDMGGTASPTKVFRDSQKIQDFKTVKLLNQRRVRSAEILPCFKSHNTYHLGKEEPNLMHWQGGHRFCPKKGTKQQTHRSQVALKSNNFNDATEASLPPRLQNMLRLTDAHEELLGTAYHFNLLPAEIQDAMWNVPRDTGVPHSQNVRRKTADYCTKVDYTSQTTLL